MTRQVYNRDPEYFKALAHKKADKYKRMKYEHNVMRHILMNYAPTLYPFWPTGSELQMTAQAMLGRQY